jgi:hypothetical protein
VPSQEWFNVLCQPHDTAATLPAQRAVLSSLILAILFERPGTKTRFHVSNSFP